MTSLQQAIKIALLQSLQLKKNETCLVVTDTLQSKIAKKFYKTASSLCRKAVYVEMTPRKRSGQEPPKKVA